MRAASGPTRGAILTATSLIAAAWASCSYPRFVDTAAQSGLTDVFHCGSDEMKKYILETLGGGVALLDYDNDGDLDAFFVSGSRLEGFPPGREPTNQLYRNNGKGSFERVTKEAGLGQAGWGQGVCAGDYDNNGFDDLFVTYYGQNHLYRNTGEGAFRDVTESAGLRQETRWSTGCSFLDYDRDGKLDLFVANYIVFDREKIPLPGVSPNCRWRGVDVLCGPIGLPAGTNQLFHNEGGGRFRNVSESSRIAAAGGRYSLSVTTLDFNHDGWLDIYVAVDSQPSLLFRNNGNGTFTETGVEAGVAYSEDGRAQSGMGSAAGDFDGDGWLDLVKTNFIDDTPNLYRNNGDESFEDYVHRSRVAKNTKYMGWGVAFLDYDNDGRSDIFMVNGHVYPELEKKAPDSWYRQNSLLYRNLDGKTMEDVTASSGQGVTARHAGRGLAAGDYDNDGDVDLFLNNMNETPSLLRNEGGNASTFVSVRLVGVKSNRSAIGARVTVVAGGRRQVKEVRSGSTYLSHSDFRLHFGLGGATAIERVEIQWPYAGSRETVTGVKANEFVTVTEGKGITDSNKPGGP